MIVDHSTLPLSMYYGRQGSCCCDTGLERVGVEVRRGDTGLGEEWSVDDDLRGGDGISQESTSEQACVPTRQTSYIPCNTQL